ncbi:hypothetical protein [Burkholderia ubonensis]|uniref:hypothetical protein n=1 Tax=Burkholderia ubonensis TaxID=101571 RepID=UPI0012F9D19A|nr:hypothetical protein [Burkholderia ubonensis]
MAQVDYRWRSAPYPHNFGDFAYREHGIGTIPVTFPHPCVDSHGQSNERPQPCSGKAYKSGDLVALVNWTAAHNSGDFAFGRARKRGVRLLNSE